MYRALYLLAFMAGGFVLNAGNAAAAPAFPPAASWQNAAGMVEPVRNWRRYCRRFGCGPNYVPGAVPPVELLPPEGSAAVEAVPLVVVPLRPRSCGEFHYWNGAACVDARYNPPYVGPKY